jgi:hypothetical protein
MTDSTANHGAVVPFGINGWDVLVEARQDIKVTSCSPQYASVELKPAIGDDYPAVLRQMKANSRRGNERVPGYKVLVFDRFTAVGATIDQVKAIFNASGFTVLSIAEVCAASTASPASTASNDE